MKEVSHRLDALAEDEKQEREELLDRERPPRAACGPAEIEAQLIELDSAQS